jgi:hypothetical protein
LSHVHSPFCFSHFGERVSSFCLVRLDYNPPFMLPTIAEMIGVQCHAVICWDGDLANFFPALVSNWSLLSICFW